MIYAGKKEDSRTSGIITIVIHAVIFLLIFFFMSFDLPDPPPAETYAELSLADFGYTDTGSGNNEGMPTQSTPVVAEETPEEAVVDDNSDISNNVQENPSPSTTPTESAAEKAERKRKEKEAREAKEKADKIAQMMNSTGGGDGNDETGGNVGTQSGQIEGKGVFGNGTGSYSLLGRGMEGEPQFKGNPKINGRVSVFVYVNASGTVTKTAINTDGTNTTDEELRELAMKMAKTAKFNSDPNAKTTQRGTITFQFKVN